MGALASSNNGSSWRRVASGQSGDYASNVSPQVLVVPFSNNGYSGLFPNDGGAKLPFFSTITETKLLSDPLGQGELFIGVGDLRRLDGGTVAPIADTMWSTRLAMLP